ncbi:MAG: choice-of-anchor D domain-containing protein, partial [Alphaproteobacteria bacterium]|nr:choice-of-anchor D domain-containing protein [Alphaproteobacteria bacterium]
NLGANNFVVGSDYTNAAFGVGNAFNRRANVIGGGQIQAAGTTQQTLTGDVTGGTTATPTMAFGNVRVGSAATRNYSINDVGSGGPSLRGAIQTAAGGGSLSDAQLSGTGVTAQNWGPVAQGAASAPFGVTFTPTLGGVLAGQSVAIVNNFDNVAGQVLSITGTGWNLAATDQSTQTINFGNFRVGSPSPTQALSVTNSAPAAFSETLNASFGTPSGDATTNGGTITNLAATSTNNTSLVVGLNTSSSGLRGGSVQVNFSTDGTPAGNSGFAATPIGSKTVNVSGTGWNLGTGAAAPVPVNLGNFRLGGPAPAAQGLAVSNTAPADGFSESVGIQTAGTTGPFNVTNNLGATRVAAGAPAAANALSISLGAGALAGPNAGNLAIQYLSDGTGTSGLGTIASNLQNVSLSATGFNPAAANTLSNVTFTNRRVGDAASQALSISNTAPTGSFTEKLNASFGTATGAATTNGGSISLLSPEASPSTAMAVGFNTATAGAKSGTVQVTFKTDGTGTSGLPAADLASQTINVSGDVYRLGTGNATPTPIDLGNFRL